jgi:hypothetical protein
MHNQNNATQTAYSDNNNSHRTKIITPKNMDTVREKPTLKKVKIKTADTVSDYYPHIDNSSSLVDSLISEYNDLYINENSARMDKDHIKREELVMVKQMEVHRKAAVKTDKDTLLNKMSGIKNESLLTRIELEVWKTPLNTKGYRMGKNKVAIYGIDPMDIKKILEADKKYYLQTKNDYYYLEPSIEFKNLKPVREKELISQLDEF